VLEANGKVNGIGLYQFRCRFKYITTSAQGADVPNLIIIDSAIAALRMREKTPFRVGFLLTYLSIDRSVYPFFATPTGVTFVRRF